ncbi:hypothetical protein DPMN_102331 [Dreissena polymorpha]|uniref:Uncharacterized protein n=1 Tax=Dreissena polymorpha TaxID=45954 RepID=A0A9D4R900_DREPO|nr:hypothetical protein DPMN_102331 [Dreissena polymorpha]
MDQREQPVYKGDHCQVLHDRYRYGVLRATLKMMAEMNTKKIQWCRRCVSCEDGQCPHSGSQ